jgi:hypothetical protein
MGIMLVYGFANGVHFESIIKWFRSIDKHAKEEGETNITGKKVWYSKEKENGSQGSMALGALR